MAPYWQSHFTEGPGSPCYLNTTSIVYCPPGIFFTRAYYELYTYRLRTLDRNTTQAGQRCSMIIRCIRIKLRLHWIFKLETLPFHTQVD